jgi:hypothetical protein
VTPEQQKSFLEEIPTDAIYDELLGRWDHIIISSSKARPEDDHPNVAITSTRWKGNPLICQGLACGIIADCQSYRGLDEEIIGADEL